MYSKLKEKRERIIPILLALILFALLLPLSYGAIASTYLHINLTTVDAGQSQVITTAVSGGNSPYTFLFQVYNPSNTLVYNTLYSEPDVMVVHPNGTYSAYRALSNNDISRGIALLQAFSNQTVGDKIYLKNESYDIGNSSLGLARGVQLYGQG